MKVLVTGARGYIGRHVLPLLVEGGHEVHAVSSRECSGPSGVHWLRADLLQPGDVDMTLERVRPEVLIHLAWYARHGSFWSAKENFSWAAATATLLDAFRRVGGRRVLVSGTCAEYDWSYGYCVEDSTPTAPHTLYGKCKDSTCEFTQAYCQDKGLEYAWCRVFFPYGPGEPLGRLLPSVLNALRQGKPVRCSHGRQFRDFMHVEDVASALVHLALCTRQSGVFNIASGEPVRLSTVIELCASHFENPAPIEYGAVPVPAGDPPMLVGSAEKLAATGWCSQITLQEGIASYVRSYIEEGK